MNSNYEKYINGITELEELLSGLTEEQCKYKPADNKWSVNEILAHLADAEVQAYIRYRAVLADDIPFLMYFNQDSWSKELMHAEMPVYESLLLLRSMRQNNYHLISSLSGEQLNREGLHSTRGKVTVKGLIESYISHLEKHMEQIKRNITNYKNSKT